MGQMKVVQYHHHSSLSTAILMIYKAYYGSDTNRKAALGKTGIWVLYQY